PAGGRGDLGLDPSGRARRRRPRRLRGLRAPLLAAPALQLHHGCQPAPRISPPRPRVPLAVRPERLAAPPLLAGSKLPRRPPRPLPHDRAPPDDQPGRNFEFFPIPREQFFAIRCLRLVTT